MAELKVGTVVLWQNLSSVLARFRLMPEAGSRFPEYLAGQYMALKRQNCRLTKAVVNPDGQTRYVPDLDAAGNQKYGPVTHSYSIASAPFETRDAGHLEFYVVLEKAEDGDFGRLSRSLFEIDPPEDDRIKYVDRIAGAFTLEKRAKGFASVFMVGTGSGLAPFASMIKQLHFDAAARPPEATQYTLLHANRTYEELGYHEELLAIEASRRLDFVYVPSVSRPTPRDLENPTVGSGRANNLLRLIVGMPPKEGDEAVTARRVVEPVLPKHLDGSMLQGRLVPGRSVILTCGNPVMMADIQHIAETAGVRFEKEDW